MVFKPGVLREGWAWWGIEGGRKCRWQRDMPNRKLELVLIPTRMFGHVWSLIPLRLILHSALSDGDVLLWLVTRVGWCGLDLLHDIHALDNLAEHDVTTIQPWGGNSGDEELGAIGVWASIGHGQVARSSVLQFEILICELLAVDGLATSAISVGEISTLDHEVLDNTVKPGTLVAEALLSSGQSTKVLGGLGNILAEEADDDLTGRLATHLDVEEHLGGDLGFSICLDEDSSAEHNGKED